MYITIEAVKKYINIPFNDDDLLLGDLIEAAEQSIANHLSRKSLAELEDENGNIPADLKVAIKTMVATLYENRESVAFAETFKVPYTLEYLMTPYRNYDKTTY